PFPYTTLFRSISLATRSPPRPHGHRPGKRHGEPPTARRLVLPDQVRSDPTGVVLGLRRRPAPHAQRRTPPATPRKPERPRTPCVLRNGRTQPDGPRPATMLVAGHRPHLPAATTVL